MTDENHDGPGYWATLHDRVSAITSWKQKCTDAESALAAKEAELQTALHTLEALVAAGSVTQSKVDQAFQLMRNLQPSAVSAPIDPRPVGGTGIDQGQFLASCGGGNQAFGERNSGGTPE